MSTGSQTIKQIEMMQKEECSDLKSKRSLNKIDKQSSGGGGGGGAVINYSDFNDNESNEMRIKNPSTASTIRTTRTIRKTRTLSNMCLNNRNNNNKICPPVLLSALIITMAILLVSSCLGVADASIIMDIPLEKRSFFKIGCKGVHDESIFARLDRVCEDCYNLFREPSLYNLCRKDCFTTYYFKGCLEALLLHDEMDDFKNGIKQLHGADPGV